jgi:hypothetical protein
MEPVRDVALLALIYRENFCMRREDLDSVADDLDACPDEVSWLTMLGVHVLTPADWKLLRALETDSDFLRFARRADPLRAEALMHACPPNGRCSAKAWAKPYRGRRWDEVEVAMSVLQEQGVTTTRDDAESLAASAWQAATGDTYEEYLDDWAPAA